MAGPKGYSLWDVVTLARVDGAATKQLTRQLRFRPEKSWKNGYFIPRWTGLFESRRSRIQGAILGWFGLAWLIALLGSAAMVLALPDDSPLAGIMSRVASGLVGLYWLALLPWALMRRNPYLPLLRRQRARFARRTMRASNAELEALIHELEARRHGWTTGGTRPTGFKQRVKLMYLYPPATILFVLGLFGGPARAVLGPMAGASAVWNAIQAISTLGSVVCLGVAFWLPGALLRRLDRSLRDGSCPDCGYDLRAVPAAIELGGATTIGPVRCPECGAPWPLLPPGTGDAGEQPAA